MESHCECGIEPPGSISYGVSVLAELSLGVGIKFECVATLRNSDEHGFTCFSNTWDTSTSLEKQVQACSSALRNIATHSNLTPTPKESSVRTLAKKALNIW